MQTKVSGLTDSDQVNKIMMLKALATLSMNLNIEKI